MADHDRQRLAALTVLGPRPVRHVLFVDRSITIGRQADCTIVLDAHGVEPVHARLWCHGDHWIVTEAPGNDDVRVNDQPIEDALLSVGDEVSIGPVALRFDGWLDGPSNPPPPVEAEPIARHERGAAAEAPIADEGTGPALMATGLGRIGVGQPGSGQPTAATPTSGSSGAADPASGSDPPRAPGPGPAPESVILLAFADAHGEADDIYLRHLVREQHTVSECLRDVERTYGCRVVCEGNVTLPRLFDLLDRFDDRIVALHYGGHASEEALMVEDEDGQLVPVWAVGLLRRLARLPRLAFIFLNGCETEGLLDGGRWSGQAWVVATLQAIRDRVACDFARRFYTALAWGSDVEAAFERARDASEARFRDPDEAWRLLRPATASGSPWPWRLLRPTAGTAGPSDTGKPPWGLAALTGAAAHDAAGRVVVDAVIQRRSPSGRLHLEVIVRNVGQRLVTLSRVLVMPFRRLDTTHLTPHTAPPPTPHDAPPSPRVPNPTAAMPRPQTVARVPDRPWPTARIGGGAPSGSGSAMPREHEVGAAMPGLQRVGAAMPGLQRGGSGEPATSGDSVYDATALAAHVDPDGTWAIPLARYVLAGDFDNFLIELDRDREWAEVGVTVIYDRNRRAVSPLVELRG